MSEPGLVAQILGRVAYEFTLVQPMIPTYLHLLVSALFPIYTGAHASLSRPSSAAKPAKKGNRKLEVQDGDESGSESEEEDEQRMEGLAPSDALIMPLVAGLTLAGLYFLIQWLKDPALLNKILNGYFALFGVFSVSRLVTDALDIGHSLIFPRRYALGGALFHVRGREKRAIPVGGNVVGKHITNTPLPGFLAKIPLSDGIREYLWSDRAMPHKKWTVRMYMHRIFAGKLRIGAHGVTGFLIALAAVGYFNLVDKPWYLTNLMGFGFCYGALQLMSPTTFATGSLVLGALFLYDIYFVFYTPMMVTVAKSLDVPIKLVFPRPTPEGAKTASHAMLGLGDIVLPGIMIGLALRFDLYLFYLRQQRRLPAPDPSDEKEENAKAVVVKPKYFSLAGRWSDHFWTHSLLGRPLFATSSPETRTVHESPFTFPKPYFTAAMVGYVSGMLATLGVMQIWNHAQPALLYLVPGVLGSLWGTALMRGEIKDMWNFSEAEEEEAAEGQKASGDKEDEPKRTSIFSLSEKKADMREERMKRALRKHVRSDSDHQEDHESNEDPHDSDTDSLKGDKASDDKLRRVASHRSDREVFSFSIEAPWRLKMPKSIIGKDGKRFSDGDEDLDPLDKGKPNWKPRNSSVQEELEPPGKKIRVL